MFKCRGCEALKSENTHLKTLIADFQELLRTNDAKHQSERKEILEVLLAATKPAGLAALQGPAARVAGNPNAPRSNFPGELPLKRPGGIPAWLGTPVNPAEV